MFNRIFIANRGEIAKRIITSIHKLRAKAILAYSTADKNEEYLKYADEIICIGDGPATSSYLNQEAVLQAAMQTKCQALHPGFGFLSENSIFASRCNQQKIKFIGPTSKTIKIMGNKSLARKIMNKFKLYSIPGTNNIITINEAIKFSQKIGYPILIKASAGGGGKCIKLVKTEHELKNNFILAKNEAENIFHNNEIYIEKYIKPARHIEFQILSDAYGNIIHLGERECSIQRNYQKLIEEAPAFNFSDSKRKELGSKICKILQTIGYEGAGTIEFLVDEKNNYYFLEMNTRLQVEHPVTEFITGIDIVSWQIKIANGEKLNISQNDIKIKGHALECRINAENPDNNFNPSPGTINLFHIPKYNNKHIRIDTHIVTGSKISPFYDSMIAKVITFENTRDKSIQTMEYILKKIKISGIKTTKALHQTIMKNKKFIKGKYNCSFFNKIKHF